MKVLGAVAAIALSLSGLAVAPAQAATQSRWPGDFHHLRLSATTNYPAREYWLYRPPGLKPGAPLVVFLHGCAQTGLDAALSTRWNDLAAKRKFAVVYPEQSTMIDGNPARCWNSGQAAIYDRQHGELASVVNITARAVSAARADRRRVYLAGLSSGALMANVMAATYPDVYKSFASIEGCSYLCGDPNGEMAYARMGPFARVMKTLVIQGTADYLTNPALGELTVSQWIGTDDFADDGEHNLSISPLRPKISQRSGDFRNLLAPPGDICNHDYPRNPCPLAALGASPYPTTIRKYLDARGQVAVESWLVHGLSHNYPGGSFEGTFSDPYAGDFTTDIFNWFEST